VTKVELIKIIQQLSPNNKRLAENLILQLAAQDGVKVNLKSDHKNPIDNIPLWAAAMRSEGLSPRTIEGYTNDARMMLKLMPQPTFLDLQGYFAERLDKVTATRVNNQQKAMKSLFKYLYQFGMYPSDPAHDIKLIHDVEKHPEMPTDEQMAAVIRHKPLRKRDRAKYITMLTLIAGTGLRITEACTLEKQFVNFTTHEIKVLGKGNKERFIPLLPVVEGVLINFMEANGDSKSKYVFPSADGTGYAYHGGFRGALRLACIKAKLPPIHPHQLRHYFATKTLEHGAKLEVISKILGHADVAITAQVYRHIQVKEYHSEINTHGQALQLGDGKPIIEGEAKLLPPAKEQNDKPHT